MPDMIEINDSNYQQFINPVVDGEMKLCACLGLWETDDAFSRASTFEQLKDVPIIPESQWDERIDQLERDRATLRNLCEDCNLHVLDQNGTNYCWQNNNTFTAMVRRLQETGQAVRLSPASVAAPIKSFSNRGGWSSNGLDWMIKNGINTQEEWPPNAIDRSYYTDENKERAKRNRVLEFFKIETWEQVGSCILAGIPVSVGYSWWGHAVSGLHITKGSHDLIIANSWGRNWSSNGYGTLTGRKKIPDDACVIVSLTAA